MCPLHKWQINRTLAKERNHHSRMKPTRPHLTTLHFIVFRKRLPMTTTAVLPLLRLLKLRLLNRLLNRRRQGHGQVQVDMAKDLGGPALTSTWSTKQSWVT